MTTYYKATFENGTTVSRSTAGRTYTHAWLVAFPKWKSPGETRHENGFSGSEPLARKALGSWTRPDLTFKGVAPAVEITSKEYRALKAAS